MEIIYQGNNLSITNLNFHSVWRTYNSAKNLPICLNFIVLFRLSVFPPFVTAVIANVSFSQMEKSVGAITISSPTFHVTSVANVICLSPGLAVWASNVQEVPTSLPWRSRPPNTPVKIIIKKVKNLAWIWFPFTELAQELKLKDILLLN